MTTSSPHVCPACQTSNPAQAAFCFGCGQPLGQGIAHPDMLHQRYHLLHQVGKGGFGAVYQAEDLPLGKRLVAVKEMSTRHMGAQEAIEAEAAFKQEALLLADLLHPNLPRIYDHFGERGSWYLVMDYIEGVTLEEYLAHTPGGFLPLAEALALGLQLCDVLDYLHTRQPPIIFRDLKPLNIMYTPSAHLYLIDFGIARHFKPGQAKDTVAFGSPGYAAPEQYGKTQTTPRSDMYSLGALLHQMLSGVDPSLNPFRFAPLRLPANQPTPSALAQLLARMLEMDDRRRPASMQQVKGELQSIASSWASGAFERLPLPSLPPKSSPDLAPALLLQTPTPSFTRGNVRSSHTTSGAPIRALAWSPDSTRLVSAGSVVEIWNAGNGKTEMTSPLTAGLRALAWSPNGQWIASAGEDRTVHVWSTRDGTQAPLYQEHTHTITGLTWSPDSQLLASSSLDKTVQVWRNDNRYRYVTYQRHKDVVYCVSWSPDGRWLASAGFDCSVHIWEAMSGKLARTYIGHSGQVLILAWSPDGTRLASSGTDASLQVWEALSGDILHSYSAQGPRVRDLSWSPNGQQLVLAAATNQALIWDLASDQQVFTYTGHLNNSGLARSMSLNNPGFPPSSAEVHAVSWSPDGNWIASGDTSGAVHIWDAK